MGHRYLRFGLSPVLDQLDPVVCDVEEEVVAKTTPGGRVVGKAQILKSSLYIKKK